MNTDNVGIITIGTVISIIVISIATVAYLDKKLSEEAIGAGYIQKVEGNKVIWVKP